MAKGPSTTKQFEDGKDHPNKPTLVGFVPAPKGTTH